MAKGFVYIARNLAMPGLIKIGRTEKIPTARLAELFTTGVPQPFEIDYYALVQDANKTELEVHRLLDRFRSNKRREFFAISVGASIRTIHVIDSPEHEWPTLDEGTFESSTMGQESELEHLINLTSRDGDESEERQLEEFAQAVQNKNLHPFVQSAFYDSNCCTCFFTLAEYVNEFSTEANEIKEIAQKTIVQFEWFDCIYHGRGTEELEF